MKYVKSLKAALVIGNSLYILIAIITSIDKGIDTDKFPISLAFVALLTIFLVLLINFGLRAYQNKNDSDSYFALLAISSLIVLGQSLIIYAFMLNPKYFIPDLPFVSFSIAMFLLWVLNVIAYLFRGRWMNK
jgi:hypothetical protein